MLISQLVICFTFSKYHRYVYTFWNEQDAWSLRLCRWFEYLAGWRRGRKKNNYVDVLADM